MRSPGQRGLLFVPASSDRAPISLVMAGVSGVLLGRRGVEAPKAKAPRPSNLAAWAAKRFADLFGDDGSDPERLLALLVSAFQMSGRLELSGPERLVMQGQAVASVDVQRNLAVRHNWPLNTADSTQDVGQRPGRVREVQAPELSRPEGGGSAGYRQLAAALNPRVSRRATQKATDGKRAWRSTLGRTLEKLAKATEPHTNLWLLIDFAQFRLRYGGKKVRKLSQGSLHTEVTRFGSALLDVLGHRPLRDLPDRDIEAAYLGVLCRKPVASRADVLEELVKFHRFLEEVHGAPSVDFAPLRAYSGPRVRTAAPGALSDREVSQVLTELEADTHREEAKPDAAPQDIRASNLRRLAVILLDASGARPASIHGLTLADLHLLQRGHDFLHVHRTGEYGEAKTLASVGFIPLDGPVWDAHRQWVESWLQQERNACGHGWWKLPVFADAPGSRRRFDRSYLMERIGQLLKWVTDDPGARVYWLRKRRITARLDKVLSDPGARPRDVYRTIRSCGHVGISTTLGSYVHDASVPVRPGLRAADLPDRTRVLKASRISDGVLDQAWFRTRRAGRHDYLGVVLDRLGVPIAAEIPGRLTPAPIMYRQKALTPKHIDQFARVLQRHGDLREALSHSGLTDYQAEILEGAAAQLLVRIGRAPWKVKGTRQRRGVMFPARRLTGSEGIFELLEKGPDACQRTLIEAWMSQPFLHRKADSSTVLLLETDSLRRAAGEFTRITGAYFETGLNEAGEHALLIKKPAKAKSEPVRAFEWVLAIQWLYLRLVERRSEAAAIESPSER